MTTSIKSVQSVLLNNVLYSNDLAETAGIEYKKWKTHIFYKVNGFSLAKNRGRLPFIEYEINNQTVSDESVEGGLDTLNILFRIHNKQSKLFDSFELTQQILRTLLRLLKEQTVLQYGNSYTVSEMMSTPYGFYTDLIVPVITSYNNTDYGNFEER